MHGALLLLFVAAAAPTDGSRQVADLVASGDFTDCKAQVERFYQSREGSLAWTNAAKLTPQAEAILQELKRADAKGLNPEDYRVQWPVDPARFDIALTVAVMRYVSDVHFGRANPGLFHAGFDLNGETDLAGFVSRNLVNAANVAQVLAAVEPPYEGYSRTQQALQQYLKLATRAFGEPLSPMTKPLDPGKPYPEAAQLAARLRLLGDLPQEATITDGVYTGPLIAAVKHFQANHGLDVDGRLGKSTLAALNVPISQRVQQLSLTLERWRWVPHSYPRAPIVVNIPEFRLRALDSSYRTELEMKVVVGKELNHQTPVFTADMKSVVFRPYWEVPISIQRKEIVPKLARDRSYLVKNRFEVVTPKNQVVSTGEVDDMLLARLRSAELRLRQMPGPENSLGLVKFLFPNEYDVYLHSTPATELFARSRRDFSHGCIRVEKPVDLAEWVLQGKPEWTRARIVDAMNGDRTFSITLDRPIPVLIVYATAVVSKQGEVSFFEDIYGLDAQLEQTLGQARAKRN